MKLNVPMKKEMLFANSIATIRFASVRERKSQHKKINQLNEDN